MHKILVVDDEEMLREAYSMMLAAAGYEVTTAFDGQDALEQYGLRAPDLILLDMMMPNLDGLGFLQALNELNTGTLPKIIIFSNLSTSEKINVAMELGAEKHITKSQMTPQQLIIEIKDMLAGPA